MLFEPICVLQYSEIYRYDYEERVYNCQERDIIRVEDELFSLLDLPTEWVHMLCHLYEIFLEHLRLQKVV